MEHNTEIGTIVNNKHGVVASSYPYDMATPWYNQGVTKIVILDAIKPTSISYWFSFSDTTLGWDRYVETIEGLSNIDTSDVTSMYNLFYGLPVTSLDISSFNTSNVTNMGSMFYFCRNLQNLTFPNTFDTSSVTNMSYMFDSCTSLTALDLSGFNTSNVINMAYMFHMCTSLASLDISSFDTSRVTTMEEMFSGFAEINYDPTTGGETVEYKGISVTSLDLSHFDTSNVTNMKGMFCTLYELENLVLSDSFDTSNVTNMNNMFSNCRDLQNLTLPSSFDTSNVTDMSFMFSRCLNLSNLTSFTDIVDTSSVTSFDDMFWNCSSLTSIDLTNFDTSSATNMRSMFEGCSSLTSLDVSGFDTSDVTNMFRMFAGCRVLTSLDLSGFDTSSIAPPIYPDESIGIEGMFYNCSGLTSLDLSDDFVTSNITSLRNLFSGCSSLTSLDLSGFDTSGVTNMAYMFSNCSSLASLDLSGFDTSNVTGSSTEYYSTGMYSMFAGCSALTVLDLSDFDTSNVTVMAAMFRACTSLTTIKVSSDFVTTGLTGPNSSTNMFYNCNSLVGCQGSNLAYIGDGIVDKTYAKIDGGESDPGLFSDTLTPTPPTPTPGGNTVYYAVTEDAATLTYKLYFSSSDLSGSTTIGDIQASGTVGTYASADDLPWKSYSLTNAEILDTINPTSMAYWFYGYAGRAITGLDKIDTSAVTDMTSLFEGIVRHEGYSSYYESQLEELDLSSWDTSNVTSMKSMFAACVNLTTLNISNLNTSAVTDMSNMFDNNLFTSLDLSNFDTSNVTNMQGMFNGCSRLQNINLSTFNTGNVTNMSAMFSNCQQITTITLLNTFTTSNVTNMKNMFGYCSQLTSLNISNFDTSSVTNMIGLFTGCSSLTTLNVSNFDTSSVTLMNTMFSGCSSLTTLDLSNFNTSSVTNMAGMFSRCTSLTTITLPTTLDTSNVTNMVNMFSDCSSLTSIDLSHFNTTNVTSMGRMFNGCTGLTTLDLSTFNTANITNMAEMFQGCTGLTTLDLSTFNTGNVENMANMFNGCTSLTTIEVSSDFVTTKVTAADSSTDMFLDCTALTGCQGSTLASIGDGVVDKTYARIDGGTSAPGLFSDTSTPPTPTPGGNTVYYAVTEDAATLTYKLYFSSSDLSGSTTIGTIQTSGTVGTYEDATTRPWRKEVYGITSVEVLDTIKPTSMKNWFYDTSINTITGINNIDTSDVTDMTNLFRMCFIIPSLDLSSWNTGNVTDMSSMFQDCVNLTSVTFGADFDTSNVTNMISMFNNCRSLTSLDVSGFDTSSVTNMGGMFLYNLGLSSLDISNFDTSSATNMGGMFGFCENVTTITLPSTLDTSNVTNMVNMFGNCIKLTSIDLSHFNTTNVTSMGRMFINCAALTTLDLSTFNTANITNMDEMFQGCTGLTTLDLSTFNTANVENMANMFNGCTGLTLIKVSNDFVTTKVTAADSSTDMFLDCTALTGCQGSTLASIGDGVVDKTYARIDGGSTAPGLFSDTLTPYVPATPVEILSVSGLPDPSGEGDHILPAGDITTLDLSNLKINVKNDDDSTSDINYTGHEADFSFTPSTLTTTTTSIKVTYKTLEKTITGIFVYATTDIKEITGVTGPTKTVYVAGDSFDPTGLTLNVTQFDGTTTTKTWTTGSTDFTFTPSLITAGTTNVRVKYGRYENCTYDIPITTTKKAKSFTINAGGIDKYYVAGDTFSTANLHDLEASVINEDDTTETITYADHADYFTFTPALGTTLAVTDTNITIGLKGKTLDHAIVVEPTGDASSATQGTPPTKVAYVEDEVFDPTGLVLNVTYPGSVTKVIEYNDETKDDFTFSPNPFAEPPETLTYGTDHVEVTYKGATVNIPITLTEKEVIDIISVAGLPGQTATSPAYIASSSIIDLSGLQVTVKYNNNTEDTIHYSSTSTELQLLPLGPADPTVTYKIIARSYEKELGQDVIFVYTDEDKKEITGITQQPTTTVYVAGDSFDPTGLEITVKGFDGTTTTKTYATNPTDFTFTPDPISAGTTNIRVKYGRYESCIYNIPITTLDKAKSFTINAGGIDKYYVAGNTFSTANLHSLEASVINEDDTTETITYAAHPDYFTFTPALGTALAVTDTKITIGLRGKTLDHAIVVEPTGNASSATQGTPPTKTTYVEGQSFDPTGLVLNVTYPGSVTKVIEYNDETKDNFSFSPDPFAEPPETLDYGTDHVVVTYKGATVNVSITLTEKQVAEILEVSGLPGQTATEASFIEEGQAIDLTNLRVKVKYNDDTEETVSYSATSTEVQLLPTGVASSTATYKIKVRTKEKVLGPDIIYVYKVGEVKKITGIGQNPAKTVYIPGDSFDPTGLILNVTQFDGTTTTKTWTAGSTDFTFTPNPITAGTANVRVKYGRYDDCIYDIPITTLKKAKSFTINDGAIDEHYNVGDTFSAANIHDLTLSVTYEDDTTETISYTAHPSYISFTPALGTELTATIRDIKVSYAGKTVSMPIFVEPTTASGASQNTPPTKTNYITGEVFDPTGLVLNVTYPGGISHAITYNADTAGSFTFSPNPFAVPPETLTYGTNQVVVTYRGAITNIPVTVRKQIDHITLQNGPSTKIYSKGDKFDPTGLKIVVSYTDTSTEEIVYNSTTASGFTFIPALNNTFTDTNVGNKVRVSFGNSADIEISDMESIYGDSFTYIIYNPATGTVTVVPNPDAPTDTTTVRREFEESLDDALSNGATGFHVIEADGVNDAKKKYNKYTPKSLTKEDALILFDDLISGGGTIKKFIAPSFPAPAPSPAPVPYYPSGGGSSSSGDSSSSSVGPMGDLINNPQYANLINQTPISNVQINTYNSISQTNLINDAALATTLQAYDQNQKMPMTNATDISGNKGFGKWQQVPGTSTWYFLSGDFSANGTKGSTGFLASGWYNLNWDGQNHWYHFDSSGVMQIGWFQDASGIYYLEADLTNNWYGQSVVGQKVIGGQVYNFGSNGALIQ